MEQTVKLYPKQLTALTSSARFVFYGGAAGGGKSHLARVAAIQAALTIDDLQIYFFRRVYQELLDNHMQGPTGFHSLLAPFIAMLPSTQKISVLEHLIKFPNGSVIHFCHCQHEDSVWTHHGKEMHFIVFEEAPQLTEFQIRFLMSRNRVPASLRIPEHERCRYPRILATGNPGGESHNFWRRLFVNQYEKFKTKEVPFPIWRMSKEDGNRTAQFIPAFVDDNPAINPEEYKATLGGLRRKELIDAMLYGSWDIPMGAFFPELDERIHRIPRFPIPKHWFKFRTFDWGSGAPFAVLWVAVSDGSIPWIPAEALVFYREWYGASPFDQSKGLGMSNEQVALGIIERSPKSEEIQGTVTDSKPFQAGGGKTIAEDFRDNGVVLQRGDVSPGSRIQGWQQIRSRAIGRGEDKYIFFFDDMPDVWRTLTQLQTSKNPAHKGEDCETTGEDHLPDAVSLACKARPIVFEAPVKIDPLENVPMTGDELMALHMKHKRREDARIR